MTIKNGMIADLHTHYGAVFTRALSDQIHCRASNDDDDLRCREVLQMVEIVQRLRDHLRGIIKQYRRFEQIEHMLMTEMEYLQKEMGEHKTSVISARKLYKTAWRDCLYNFECLKKRWGLKEGQA